MSSDSTFTGERSSCPCGSSDGVAHYSDGHTHCFVCGKTTFPRGSKPSDFSNIEPTAAGMIAWWVPEEGLPHRSLEAKTLHRYRYGLGRSKRGTIVEVANYMDASGRPVAQKIRKPDKKFIWTGKPKEAVLFGSHLVKKGKRLVITEGEIDCLTVAEILKLDWPVWSLMNGAGNGAKDLTKAIQTLENFEEVVLMFDGDEAGLEGAEKAAKALCSSIPVKMAARMELKDANDMWRARRGKEVLQAIWDAAPYRPKTIVSMADVVPRVKTRKAIPSIPYPYECFNKVIGGIRDAELVTIVMGSGTGKSTLCRSFLEHIQVNTEDTSGGLFIEESLELTTSSVIGMRIGKNIAVDPMSATEEEIQRGADELRLVEKPLYLFDLSFEVINADELLSQLHYMAKGLGCKRIFLDHLSFIVGGMETSDERKAIDVLMTKLRGFVKTTGVTLFLVVHLKRPEGNRGYDEGLQVSTNFIRGSQSIEQLSDVVIAGQRNKRSATRHNWLEMVSLKCRFNGNDGKTIGWLEYQPDTGRLVEGTPPADGIDADDLDDDCYVAPDGAVAHGGALVGQDDGGSDQIDPLDLYEPPGGSGDPGEGTEVAASGSSAGELVAPWE